MKRGFTLIELLMVVAVILILVAIATPSFLAAHLRASVARTSVDLHTVATALEEYFCDYTIYPIDHDGNWPAQSPDLFGLTMLTTPTKYLSSLVRDIFGTQRTIDPRNPALYASFHGGSGSDNEACGGRAVYRGVNRHKTPECAHAYLLLSLGPDRKRSTSGITAFPSGESGFPYPLGISSYTPSNGILSQGDLYQAVGDWKGRRVIFDLTLF